METGLRDGLQVVEKYVSVEDRLIILNKIFPTDISE